MNNPSDDQKTMGDRLRYEVDSLDTWNRSLADKAEPIVQSAKNEIKRHCGNLFSWALAQAVYVEYVFGENENDGHVVFWFDDDSHWMVSQVLGTSRLNVQGTKDLTAADVGAQGLGDKRHSIPL